jgi:hypothetical protein
MSAAAFGATFSNPVSVPAAPAVVAFGTWRCNCTMLAATLADVPGKCPTHGDGLLGPAEWTTNPHRKPLGLKPDHRLVAAEVSP